MNLTTIKLTCSNPIHAPNHKLYKPSVFRNPRFLPLETRPSVAVTAAAASSTLAVTADESVKRIESLGQVSGVLGCQWGDEGKGKLVDILAEHFDVVARCQVDTYFTF